MIAKSHSKLYTLVLSNRLVFKRKTTPYNFEGISFGINDKGFKLVDGVGEVSKYFHDKHIHVIYKCMVIQINLSK